MDPEIRFFVSFSSRDLKYVREIMSALKGQELDFWDYTDINQSIKLGITIKDRLVEEIDKCTHMVVVISENSMDPYMGQFCRFELEYALKNSLQSIKIIPVIIDSRDIIEWIPPYEVFEKDFCQELDDAPESIVRFTVKVCQLINKVYVPPIEAHPNLPFWKLFRKEVKEMAHSNKEHVDIMMILGDFNEYYRKTEMERAYFLIKLFISTCEYKVPDYKPFYPWIVKAVCETELAEYDRAILSYEKVKTYNPENQDVIGGIGTVYFKKQQYLEAAACFKQIIRDNTSEDVSNARINLIITKQSMGVSISDEEREFLFKMDIDHYPDDLKTAVLNAQAIQYRIEGDPVSLEQICSETINKNLHDTITIRLLQISLLNRGMYEAARQVIEKALEEANHNPRLDSTLLMTFL